MRFVLWTWIAVFLGGPARAQLPTVEASIDTAQVTLGDPVELRFKLRYPPAYRPVPAGELGLPTELQARPLAALKGPQGDAASEQVWRYELKSFALGTHVIPPLAVQFAAAGDTLVRHSAALELEVGSVRREAEGQEPRDIEPPFEIPGGLPLWLAVALGTALLAAAVFGLLWYLDRRRQRPASLPPLPPVDYIAELGRIELEQADFKAYYSRLADLLRRFLEERLGVEALERTTGEIVRALRQTELEEAQVAAIGAFLDRADLVKFARFTPPLEEARSAPEAAVGLVRAVDAFKERQLRRAAQEAAVQVKSE